MEQYFDYTVDVASLFSDADDSWLTYSVSVDGGEEQFCGETFSIAPKTTDTKTLKFYATDFWGAKSEAYTVTLNVDPYKINEGWFPINNMTADGGLLSMTVKDDDGNIIEGVKIKMTSSVGEDDYKTLTHTLDVALPGDTVGTNDQITSFWHMVYGENGQPILEGNNTKDGVKTTLSGGLGSAELFFYEEVSDDVDENYENRVMYVVNYHIVRDNNQAPVFADGVDSTETVTMDQYETYSVNLNDIFSDPEGDEVTYSVSVDGAEATPLVDERNRPMSSYSMELTTDEDHKIFFYATDALGDVSNAYAVKLKVNTVKRYIVETGESGHWARGGVISDIIVYDQDVEKHVYEKIDDTHRDVYVQLKDTVADDAEVRIEWNNNNCDDVKLTPANPIKLVDGKATAEIESCGNFFFGTHYYYTIHLTNTPNTMPTLADGVEAETSAEVLVGAPYELDLSALFTDGDGDELTYTVSVNDGEETAADKAYSFTSSKTGDYKLVFRAKDNWGTSEATYTVNLKVKNSDNTLDVGVKVPANMTPSFYVNGGYDENGMDVAGEKLISEKGDTVSGWTSYTVKVPDNISSVSIRGTDADGAEWGGMAIDVSAETESVTLRPMQAIINTLFDKDGEKVAPTAEEAVFKVKYGEGHYAVTGGSFNDSEGYLCYRFFLVAGGNDLIYTYYSEPLGDLAKAYAVNQGDTKTITAVDSAPAISLLPLATKSAVSITAPADADVEMFRQSGYFNGFELAPFSTTDNKDGTKTVIFNNPGDKSMYRVSMEGKVTKAGYVFGRSGGEYTINWDGDDRTPDYRGKYTGEHMMNARADDSMYVNVNYRNNLQLGLNEEFQLRAYRIWEIIDTDTTNIMIEPDFWWNVVAGDEDVISIATAEGCTGGNAKNNWLDMKALKEGTAVVEVGYDAIEILKTDLGDGTSNDTFGNYKEGDFTFNAVDPARTALVVVQVGDVKNDIDFGIKGNSKDGWDVEFDTFYFLGETGQMQLKPTVLSGEGSVAKVEISGDKGNTYTELMAAEDGYYTAELVHGNNIIRVTKDDGSEHYQVVRGDKITTTVTEVKGAADMDGVIEAGEKINIQFNGTHNVVGKMSGIYNPTDYKTHYTFNGEEVVGDGGQYTYPSRTYVQVTIPGTAEDGDIFTLTHGYTTNGGWGSAGGAHRAVKGEVPPNLDADGISNSGRNVFPEITLTVGETIVNEDDSQGGEGEGGEGGGSDDNEDVISAPIAGVLPENIDFDLSENQIKGYVTVSFVDNGVRSEEVQNDVAEPLGVIIPEVKVPYKTYDTIASVTLRALSALGYTAGHQGDEYSSFYLGSIGNFYVGDVYYGSFGEFDAGPDSGWMVTWNNWFIGKGASEFMVEDGDRVEWQYTCDQGADVGSDRTNLSAKITGLVFAENYGTLTPAFDEDVTEYVYTISESVKSIALETEMENYWARTTYTVGDKQYKPMQDIPVVDGTVINISSAYSKNFGETPVDTDELTITVRYAVPEDPVTPEDPKDEVEVIDPSELPFSDVSVNNWFAEEVAYVYSYGLMNGTSATIFAPEANLTRAMMVTILYRIEGEPAVSGANPFGDLEAGKWYTDAIVWAAENGIVKGITTTTYEPDTSITREQMAVMMYRYAQYKGADVSASEGLGAFTDAGNVSSWAEKEMKWAVGEDLINGMGDNTLAPQGTATRAQAATVLMRFHENIVK